MRRSKHPRRIIKTVCSTQTEMGEIPFILARSSARRTLTITIDEKADVSVASPFRMKERDIHDFINEKAQWIIKKINEARKNRVILDQKKFDHGDQFLFLGKKYTLSIIERNVKRGHVSFNALEGWFITIPQKLSLGDRRVKVRAKMLQWYRVQAKEILGGRLFHYARLIGVEPKKIVIRTQKRIWGCCDYSTQTIHLNWQIILSPIKVIDYVVIHELCHLTIPNHSKRFWKKVEKVMPDFKRYKQWLTVNHLDMALP